MSGSDKCSEESREGEEQMMGRVSERVTGDRRVGEGLPGKMASEQQLEINEPVMASPGEREPRAKNRQLQGL